MKKALSLAVVLLLITSAASAASTTKPALSLPISGTFVDAAGGAGTFSGTFKLTRFEASGSQLLANGYLTGTLTDSLGVPVGSVVRSVSIPVDLAASSAASSVERRRSVATNATCDVLNLVLGPLHLDLLGLTVDLNQVVLDIAAQTGAGNLLGNLLCAVVSLLDGAGALVDIAHLLNQILDILTGILG
jgi:hypothetical protein